MLFEVLALVAVAAGTVGFYSDLKTRRISNGWALGVSIATMVIVYGLTYQVVRALVGWVPVLGNVVPLVAAAATVAFWLGFAKPLAKQLKK